MSDLAIELINDVKEKRSTKLDLGKCDLKEIPDEVFDLHWLEDLNFGAHYWNRETHKFSRTRNNLSENTISHIPGAIRHLSNLKSFNLSNNTFRHFTFSGVEQLSLLPDLVVLELSFGRIATLEWLNGLTNLQVLNLIANAIDDIHPLRGLTGLRIFFWKGMILPTSVRFPHTTN